MIITKKAWVGFILLALIVFPTAYLSWSPSQIPIAPSAANEFAQQRIDAIKSSTIEYRQPLVAFSSASDMAVACTIIIELFTLCCYLILKRIEPAIKAWEQSERERIANEKGNP